MAVDDRFKRASAMAMIVPSLFTLNTDGNADVDSDERVAAAWMYSGITIAGAAPIEIGPYYYLTLLAGN